MTYMDICILCPAKGTHTGAGKDQVKEISIEEVY